MDGADLEAIRQLVFAGFPTTKTCQGEIQTYQTQSLRHFPEFALPAASKWTTGKTESQGEQNLEDAQIFCYPENTHLFKKN